MSRPISYELSRRFCPVAYCCHLWSLGNYSYIYACERTVHVTQLMYKADDMQWYLPAGVCIVQGLVSTCLLNRLIKSIPGDCTVT